MAGIYVTTELAETSSQALRTFVENLPLPKGSRMREKEYHITLAYSKAGFDYKHSALVDDASCRPVKWDVFGTDEKVVVLVMESETLQKRFEELCAQGYKSSFPDYKPHITIATADENTDVSSWPIPKFEVRVLREYSEPLDSTFSYKPKEMCESDSFRPISFFRFITEIC